MNDLIPFLLVIGSIVLLGPVLAVIALVQIASLRRELRRSKLDLPGRATVRPARRTAPVEPVVPVAPPVRRPVQGVRQSEPDDAVDTSPRPAPKRRPRLDWERWVGVRGAAVLGAAVLALAAILFFQYSVEQGWVTPLMRVVLGTVAGLTCMVGSRPLHRRGYDHAANGIAGAGIVALYAASWASHALYGMIGLAATFVCMMVVTGLCCLLAYRRHSQVVAVLALVGGFATPLLLATSDDHPVGLFGYVLLLDLGLLMLGSRRRWPSLALLTLIGTVLIESLWLGDHVGPDRLAFGLIVLGVFGGLFAVGVRWLSGPTGSRVWRLSRIGGVLFPFSFALYFAARADLAEQFLPVSLLVALLSAAACWLAREPGMGRLASTAAVGSLGILAVKSVFHPIADTGQAWELVLVGLALAGLFHVFVEWDRRTDERGLAAATFGVGFFILTIVAAVATDGVPALPWLVAWIGLASLIFRQSTFANRGLLQPVAAACLAAGLVAVNWSVPARLSGPWLAMLMIGTSVALLVMARVREGGPLESTSGRAAGLFSLLALGSFTPTSLTGSGGPWIVLGGTSLLALGAMIAASRLRSGRWAAIVIAILALVQGSWTYYEPLARRPREAGIVLVLLLLPVLILSAWPLIVARRLDERAAVWRASALVGALWFLPVGKAYHGLFGDDWIGAFPVILGGIALAAAWRARTHFAPELPMRLTALVWYSAVATALFSVAVPMQLERQWLTLGWTLEGLALLLLWRRLDHPGLKYTGLALLTVVGARLVATPGYYPRPELRILNWMLYTYWLAAAALLAASRVLQRLEVDRLRPTERRFYGRLAPAGAAWTGFLAVAVTFVWINLAIADWFATGDRVLPSLGGTPAHRLTVSLAWALFGLFLLGAGLWQNMQGLRWVSLGFLFIAIGKVFLYDLGNLHDLWRVASLVGLAASLLSVSLLYQRFVFRSGRPAPTETAEPSSSLTTQALRSPRV